MTKRLLITGASGYLGHRLVPLSQHRAKVIAVSRQPHPVQESVAWLQADLTQDLRSLFKQHQPDAVIHAAAINPGVDDSNLFTNEVMAVKVAEAAAAVNARLVVVSSDMVHDGNAAPYADDAEATPVNAYGQSKAAAEVAALTRHGDAVCVRTSLIYGFEQIDRGTSSFISRLEQGERQTVFDNIYRQPVWVDALAEGLLRLALDLDVMGTLNLAGDELISRAAFAKVMLSHWGYSLKQVDQGPAPADLGIPMNLALKHDKAKMLGLAIPGVSEVLSRVAS